MALLVLFFLMLLNVGIWFWNSRQVGLAWYEANHAGGWLKLLVWSVAIHSALALTWVFFVIFGFIGITLGKLDYDALELFWSLGYVLIVPGILFTGVVIWIHSVARAYRTRQFGDIAVAGYNTFAQGYNTYRAVQGFGPALGKVLEGFGKAGKGKNGGSVILILLAIIAILAGFILTAVVIRHYAASEEAVPENY